MQEPRHAALVDAMKGQLSAEMLVMIVVVLAVVAIAASQLLGSAKQTGAGIRNETERIGRMAAESMKSAEGEYCIYPEDCVQGLSCSDYRCS